MGNALALGPIGQISRRVKDIAAARSWYGDVLGLQHLYSSGDLAFFDCAGVRLFLSQENGAAPCEDIGHPVLLAKESGQEIDSCGNLMFVGKESGMAHSDPSHLRSCGPCRPLPACWAQWIARYPLSKTCAISRALEATH